MGGPHPPACHAPSPTIRRRIVKSSRFNGLDSITDQRGSISTCTLKVRWNLGPPITFFHRRSKFHCSSESSLSRLHVDQRWALSRPIILRPTIQITTWGPRSPSLSCTSPLHWVPIVQSYLGPLQINGPGEHGDWAEKLGLYLQKSLHPFIVHCVEKRICRVGFSVVFP